MSAFKFPSLALRFIVAELVESWIGVSVSQVLDPSFKNIALLASLKSSDRTKQSVCG